MKWFLVCLLMCVYSATAIELGCRHQLCAAINSNEFNVEGRNITITYSETNGKLMINCRGWPVLDSIALPHFTEPLLVSSVKLDRCPPPLSRSYAVALAALDVILANRDHEPFTNQTMDLALVNIPFQTQLTAQNFAGLKYVTKLKMSSTARRLKPVPEAGFLEELPVLRRLVMAGVELPATELNRLPPTLNTLIFDDEDRETNPKAKGFRFSGWKEMKLVPLERCDNVQKLILVNPSVKQLPGRWIAACPNLEKLEIAFANNLYSLPANLLENATSLTNIVIYWSKLTSLPDGLLEGAPNLIRLDLTHNDIQTISSGAFLGPRLQHLLLPYNKLKTEALNALAPLTSLTKLDLTGNSALGDFCDQNGYSPLRNLTQLRLLYLGSINITRICRDWREDMKYLELLHLWFTEIPELTFNDFQYHRDETVKNATVDIRLRHLPLINFSEEDFTKALTAPPTGATMWVRWESDGNDSDEWFPIPYQCDCRMYWTWRVVVDAKHTMNLYHGIPCQNKRFLNQMTLEQLCPERATVQFRETTTPLASS